MKAPKITVWTTSLVLQLGYYHPAAMCCSQTIKRKDFEKINIWGFEADPSLLVVWTWVSYHQELQFSPPQSGDNKNFPAS